MELEIEHLDLKSKIDNALTPESLEKLFLENLPNVAHAIASSLNKSKITLYSSQDNSSASPVGIILNEIMMIIRNRISELAKRSESEQINN